MTLADQIEKLVSNRSDMTEAMLAETIFGPAGYQQQVNSTCRKLIKQGKLRRSGKGGVADPYTYGIPR